MRIGLTNMTISKLFPQKTAFSQPKINSTSVNNNGHRNTLADFLSGHRKNSYGVEGMCATIIQMPKKSLKYLMK